MDSASKYRFQASSGFGFGLIGASFFLFFYHTSKDSLDSILSMVLFIATLALFFFWCYLFSKIGIEYLDKCFPLTLIVMGGSGGILYLMPDSFRSYTVISFLAISIILYVLCLSSKSSFSYDARKWKYPRELLQKPLIYLFAYGISYGVVVGICSSESVLSQNFSPIPTMAIGCAFAGAVAFGMLLVSNTPKALDVTTRISLGSIVASLLLLLVVNDSYTFFGIATVLSFGIGLFLFLYLRMSFDLFETFRFNFLILLSSLISFFVAIFLGTYIGIFILPTSPQIAIIICVLVITLVTLYGLGSNRVWTAMNRPGFPGQL